jgi:putative tryptophan/tyrosine transport system substrate-binding protein
MRRREVLALVGSSAVAWPLRARGQPASRVYRLGFLSAGFSDNPVVRSIQSIAAELARFGFSESKNLLIEARYAEGRAERLPELAKEIAATHADVILAVSTPAAHAAKDAAPSTPVVMAFSGEDPVAAGLVASLARPGGNVTGIALLAAEMDAKRVELLAQAVPNGRRLVLFATRYAEQDRFSLAQHTANSLSVELVIVRAGNKQDYNEAFAAIARAAPAGIVIGSSPVFFRDGAELAALAAALGLPTICEWREMAEQGCLLSFGPRVTTLYRRAAGYVARIFQGANPADLPVEQPTTFEIAINLKTAKTLGITLPLTLQAQADEVIE